MNMKKRFTSVIIPSILLMLIIFTSTYNCTPAQSEIKTLKIGFINSITGPLSAGFKAVYDAVKPAEAYLNDKGGIKVGNEKYLLEIIAQDDQSTPGGAVAGTQALIQSNVKFILSSLYPPSLQAMTPIAEEAKIISINPMQVDGSIFSKSNRYSFNAFATAYNTYTSYDFLQKNYPNVKKIAIIAPDDPGAHFVLDIVNKEVPKRGLQIVSQELFSFQVQDFYPTITKALGNNPDAIDTTGGILPWANGIIESARQLGFTGPIFCSSVTGDINQLKAMTDPQYCYDFFQAAPDVLSDQMLPIVKNFQTTVEQANIPFTMDSVLVLSALLPLIQSIEKAQSLDTDKVIAALEELKSVDTCWGPAQWRGEDLGLHHMLVVNNPPLSRITKDGNIEFEYLKK